MSKDTIEPQETQPLSRRQMAKTAAAALAVFGFGGAALTGVLSQRGDDDPAGVLAAGSAGSGGSGGSGGNGRHRRRRRRRHNGGNGSGGSGSGGSGSGGSGSGGSGSGGSGDDD